MMALTKTLLLGAGGLALTALGFVAGRFTASPSPIPDGYYDLSAMSPEARKLAANPAFFDMLAGMLHFENGQLKFYAPQLEQQTFTPPAGYPAWPSALTLSAPRDGMGWIDAKLAGGEALATSKDQWTVVNLWAIWCAPCIAELPDLDRLAAALKGKVNVFAINADNNGKDTPETVKAFFVSKSMTALAPLHAGADQIDSVLAGAGFTRQRLAYPMTVIYAPGGKPFAYVQDSAENWQSGESGWYSPELIAYFEKLAPLPAPG